MPGLENSGFGRRFPRDKSFASLMVSGSRLSPTFKPNSKRNTTVIGRSSRSLVPVRAAHLVLHRELHEKQPEKVAELAEDVRHVAKLIYDEEVFLAGPRDPAKIEKAKKIKEQLARAQEKLKKAQLSVLATPPSQEVPAKASRACAKAADDEQDLTRKWGECSRELGISNILNSGELERIAKGELPAQSEWSEPRYVARVVAPLVLGGSYSFLPMRRETEKQISELGLPYCLERLMLGYEALEAEFGDDDWLLVSLSVRSGLSENHADDLITLDPESDQTVRLWLFSCGPHDNNSVSEWVHADDQTSIAFNALDSLLIERGEAALERLGHGGSPATDLDEMQPRGSIPRKNSPNRDLAKELFDEIAERQDPAIPATDIYKKLNKSAQFMKNHENHEDHGGSWEENLLDIISRDKKADRKFYTRESVLRWLARTMVWANDEELRRLGALPAPRPGTGGVESC